ncbi:MAG: ATP-binding protein [Cytophagales bacterium]|nr:MAG: ATP-binding protein [Cytophagales bacterium]
MIERSSYKLLVSHLTKKQVTVITGLRRVGKTTAVRYLLEQIPHTNKLYLDLEKAENRLLFNQSYYSDIEVGLTTLGLNLGQPAVLALDEVQLVRNIPSVIKYLYDTYSIKFILTGSSSYYLKNHFTESLAGRKRIFELYPLHFGEFLHFRGFTPTQYQASAQKRVNATAYAQFGADYEQFIRYGGFPEVVQAETDDDKRAFLKDIVNAYIELDIKLLSDFSVSDDLYRLCQLLATHTGSRLDVSKLCSILGVNRNKLNDYLNLFEYTYFIHRIPAFTTNKDREISLQKKVYLADTGLLTVLAQVSSGQQFENAVALQLGHIGTVQYYQRRSGQEIDFILNQTTAIEVKETATPHDLAVLNDRATSVGLSERWLVGRRTPAAGTNFTDWYWGGSLLPIGEQ